MDIAAGILAATEGIKLARELRNLDCEIDKAELKLRRVDLVGKLLETKEALQDAKEERRGLAAEIFALKAAPD